MTRQQISYLVCQQKKCKSGIMTSGVVKYPYMACGHGPIRGNMSPAATLYVNIRTLEGVLRCEKMLKCVHDYFVYLK
jgi:hypothetical protein